MISAVKRTCLSAAAAALFAATAPLVAQALPADQPQPAPGARPDPATIAAWQARKFGMFIHFGLYSIPGGVWDGQRIDYGYSEQIMANAPIPKAEYEKLATRFNPEKFDPDAIAALAKAAGMKFIVITAKHHDGFNLFRTGVSRFSSVDGTPYGKDIVGQMAEACRRAGLSFGVYYSTIDWHQPGGHAPIASNGNALTPAQEAFNIAQLKELATNYGPLSEVWFDMGGPTPAQSAAFARAVHAVQPRTMVSGRVWNYQGDFAVMSDNALPHSAMEEPWQAPASIFDETWGYRAWQAPVPLARKVAEHVGRLVHVVSAGGNYLLNIGPMGDGSIVPYEADVLTGVGRWLATNGEAIYESARQPFGALDFGYATVKPGKLYLFVRDMPADGVLRLPGVVGAPFGAARVLGGDGTPLAVRADAGGTSIDVSRAGIGDALMPVIAIDLVKPLTVRPAAIPPAADGSVRLFRGSAERFRTYNGFAYDDASRVYKLRWHAALPAGRYQATVRLAAPPAKTETVDLIVDAKTYRLTLAPGATEASVMVTRDETAMPFSMQVAVTPKQPFYRGVALPVEIGEIDLRPAGAK